MNRLRQFRGKYMKPWLFNSIVGIAVTGIVGGAGTWIQGVNANIDKTEEVHIILPRIERHMERQEKKLDEIGERTANIEGQLKRR